VDTELKRRVKQTIIDCLILDRTPEELGDRDDLDLVLSKGMDSVSYLEILIALEDEFQVELRGVALTKDKVGTVEKLVELVARAQAPGSGER
jgi:acyl carrier protein